MQIRNRNFLLIVSGLLIMALAAGIHMVQARPAALHEPQASVIHPTFKLLDRDAEQVQISGGMVSTLQTCGQCHDTDFIQGHAFHSDLGFADYQPDPETWDAGPGLFGKWDPLTYRFLSQAGDERLDLTTAEWLMLYGDRAVGGGPAVTSRAGIPLEDLSPSAADPETSLLDPLTGRARAWDWTRSGTMEMNCFLCHLEEPNNAARVQAIRAGEFDGANTATLLGTGIVTRTANGWYWNDAAFDATGELTSNYVLIQDPTNENCGQCHGAVHTDIDLPLVLDGCNWETATTGQIISPQRIADSGMNIASKDEIARTWDVHAERQLKCTDCHYSLNNPVYQQTDPDSPEHLTYDPRRLELGEYLQRPDHNLARGQSAQYNLAPDLKGTMRRCEACHDANAGHADWLPYIERHMNTVACETCHIPRMYAPAIQSYDWTVIRTNSQPVNVCRGLEITAGERLTASADPNAVPLTVNYLVDGYQPVLLNRTDSGGGRLLAPYNLITSFYWVYEDGNGNIRPVRLLDLEAVYLQDGGYAPEILSAFDANLDGSLDAMELVIDTESKHELVAARLTAIGLKNPRIEGRVQPYSISHSVAEGKYSLNDCRACHNRDSRTSRPIKLADYAPGGVMPEFVTGTNVSASGQIAADGEGALYYQPQLDQDELYVFGSSRVNWVDRLGALFFAGTVLAVGGHGTRRYLAWLRRPKTRVRTEKIYMYQAYTRFWHWLQTAAIVILLLTGLIIHRPDLFGAFSFHGVVIVHNVLGAILALNAALAVFYHLTTGRLREYIPRPYGFFDDAILQAKFYVQGIFKGEHHPFEKNPENRTNPLQRATYFGILNVLLPLQILSGVLMWGIQRWPGVTGWFGGLPLLAPFHTLIAWTFASFMIAHVYLTTTGASPLEAMRGMVTGWEEVEIGK